MILTLTNPIMKKQTIDDLQSSSDYVILNNPLASPKFIRMISKGNEITVNDIYTPKVFYEIASRLTPEHLSSLHKDQNIVFEIQIKEFLESIGANKKNYKHLIESIDLMQSSLLRWKEGDEIITTAIIAKSKHNPKTGKIKIYVDNDIARRILEIKEDGNFSFLKSNVFRLQNTQAIKLYPFFKSWLNHGHYSTDLERFKIQFGYHTSGYRFWNNFKEKVLEQGTQEINSKTDIHVSYEPTGDNLGGKRPRIKGIKFRIQKRDDVKLLPETSPTSHQSQIDDLVQPGLLEQNKPISELTALIKKIPIQDSPAADNLTSLIGSLVSEIGYQATKDGLLGMIESKAKPKTIAFFTPANLKKHLGFEKAQQEIKDKKQEQKNKEQEQIRKQRMIEELQSIYNTQKNEYLKRVYADIDQESKERYLQELWDSETMKSIYFRGGDRKAPNNYAIHKIAEGVAFPQGYDEQKNLQSFALTNYNLRLDFNESGEIIMS